MTQELETMCSPQVNSSLVVPHVASIVSTGARDAVVSTTAPEGVRRNIGATTSTSAAATTKREIKNRRRLTNVKHEF